MLRQVSSRNHRSKGGFKLKNGIQMGLLVVICFWLLYQMKHSHDKKQAAYAHAEEEEEEEEEKGRVDSTRFGRKSLPHAREINPEAEGLEKDEDGKASIKHGASDRLHMKLPADEGNRSGREKEEASREAREKSFRGDDASSEVVHDPQGAERDEASHEAQERRFRGDDASSAVEHFAETRETEAAEETSFKDDEEVPRFVEHFALENESETGTGTGTGTEARQSSDGRPNEYTPGASWKGDASLAELLDASEGSSNWTVGNKEDESPPDRILGSNATSKVESITPPAEENPQGKTEVVGSVNYNRTESATNSTYGSEDPPANLPVNSSSVTRSQLESQKMVVDLATNLAYPQDQFAVSHTSQDRNASAIETPAENNYSLLLATDTVTNIGAMEESSKSPSGPNENGTSAPFGIRPSSHGVREKEEQKDARQFNLQNIRRKVDDDDSEAAR